jgi:drug/metabolite transporter (DMT)-like permease
MPTRRPPIPPALAIFFGILAVSTASIFIRYAQQDAPSLVIAAWRLSIAALVLAPLALARHRAELRALTPGELGLARSPRLPGCPLRHLDHFAGIHHRRQLRRLG